MLMIRVQHGRVVEVLAGDVLSPVPLRDGIEYVVRYEAGDDPQALPDRGRAED